MRCDRDPPGPRERIRRLAAWALIAALVAIPMGAAVQAGTVPDPPATCRHYRCRDWHRHAGSGLDDEAAAIAAGGGRVAVTQTVGPAWDRDVLTVVYDVRTGNEIWSDRYDGDGDDRAFDVTIDDRHVFVAGSTGSTDRDVLVLAYAPDGTRDWVGRHDDPFVDGADDVGTTIVATVERNHVFVGGYNADPGEEPDSLFLFTDADDGAPIGSLEISDVVDDRIVDLELGPDEAWVYSVASADGDRWWTGERDVEVSRRRVDDLLDGWHRTAGTADDDVPVDLEVAPDGKTVLVAATAGSDYLTQARDAASGDLAWSKRFLAGRAGDAVDGQARDLAWVAGRVAVTGTAGTVAFHDDGTPAWFHTLPAWRGEAIQAGPRDRLLYLARSADDDLRVHGLDPVAGLVAFSARHDDGEDAARGLATGTKRVVALGTARRGDVDVTTTAFDPEPTVEPPDVHAKGCGDAGAEVTVSEGQVLWLETPGRTVGVCIGEEHGAHVSPPGDTIPCPNPDAGSGSGGVELLGVGAWLCYGFDNDQVWLDTSRCTTPDGQQATDPGAGVPGLWVAVCAWASPPGPSDVTRIDACGPGRVGVRIQRDGGTTQVCLEPDVTV